LKDKHEGVGGKRGPGGSRGHGRSEFAWGENRRGGKSFEKNNHKKNSKGKIKQIPSKSSAHDFSI